MRLGEKIVWAPLLWLGNSHHHLDFAGTLSAAPRTYLDVLGDLIDNMVAHGFRRIVLLNGHGGNIVPASQAVFEARQRYRDRDDLLLLAATYWLLGSQPKTAGSGFVQDFMGHACEWETSMILALAPHLVGDLRSIEPVPSGNLFEPALARLAHPGPECGRPHWRPSAGQCREGRNSLSALFRRRGRVPGARGRLGWADVEWVRCNLIKPTSVADFPNRRTPLRTWGICGLMLLATMLNYMDRQTLAQQATEIRGALELSNEDYGKLETGFGLAFAVGGIATGFIADRLPLRWLYPAILLGWSAVGFVTGWVTNYTELFVCRVMLGFLRGRTVAVRPGGLATAALKPQPSSGQQHPPERSLAGSDRHTTRDTHAQYGRAGKLAATVPGDRRRGSRLGLRLAGVDPSPRPGDHRGFVARPSYRARTMARRRSLPKEDRTRARPSGATFLRRFLALVVVVIMINFCWQYFRAWMPMMLEKEHGYTNKQTQLFSSAYYLVAGVGCIAVGFLVKWLAARGWSVHRARMATFLVCALLTGLGMVAAFLPASVALACALAGDRLRLAGPVSHLLCVHPGTLGATDGQGHRRA